MPTLDALRRETEAARTTVLRRAHATTDPQERAALGAVADVLERELRGMKKATPLEAANALANVAAQVEAAVGAARLGPFDGHLSALEHHIDRFGRLSQRLHAADSLRAARPATRTGKKKRRKQPRSRAASSAGRARAAPLAATVTAPIASTSFPDLQAEYADFYARCTVRPESQGNVAYYVKRLNQGRPAYEAVGAQLGIPWAFVGVIHGMECGFNFSAHLHNGDPLTARTVQVPKGRPANGNPPFTWRDSAVDALRMKKLDQVGEWSMPRQLYLLEAYNGFGYRKRGVPSPYLWSFSNIYEKGKFVKDGVFDPSAVSKQCGVALMLKALLPA